MALEAVCPEGQEPWHKARPRTSTWGVYALFFLPSSILPTRSLSLQMAQHTLSH